MITRGTTPIISFRFTADYSSSSEIELTFSQGGNIVLVFDKSEMDFSTETVDETTYHIIQIGMTQEQANLFGIDRMAEVQFRFKNASGVSASTIKRIDVYRILNDEVM